MKHKIGDVVKIKSREWWASLPKNAYGNYESPGGLLFNKDMVPYLGRTYTIERLTVSGYYKLSGIGWSWADWMFEEPTVEDVEFEEIPNVSSSDDPYNWLF